ncbi:MAG: gliding motility-associated C-terminal domain-containing protein [Bacteroidota bacterium]
MTKCIRLYVALLFLLVASSSKAQAPVNDNCEHAALIVISGNGYNTGVFKGAKTDVSNATLQKAEQCVKDLEEVGNCTKSVWYKFYIPTTRNIGIALTQKDSAIPQIFAGFNIYSIPNCEYTEQDIEGGLPPLNKFGISGNSCLEAGWYLIQVGCKKKAKGELWIELNVSLPASEPYDNIATYLNFYVKDNNPSYNMRMSCASLEPLEYIPINDSTFTKSVWFCVTLAKNAVENSIQISNSFGNAVKYRIFVNNINSDSMLSNKPFLTIPLDGKLINQSCPPNNNIDQKYFFQIIGQKYITNLYVSIINSTFLADPWNTPKTNVINTLDNNSSGPTKTHYVNCESLLKSHTCKNVVPEFFIYQYKQWQNGQTVMVDDTFFYGTYSIVKLLNDGKLTITTSNDYTNNQLILYSLYAGDITKTCNLKHIKDTFVYGHSWYGYEQCLSQGTYTLVTGFRDLNFPKINQSMSLYKNDAEYKYYYPKTPEKLKDFNPLTDSEFTSDKTCYRPKDTTLKIDTAILSGRMTFREIYISESGDFNISSTSGSVFIFGGQLSNGNAKTLANINYKQSKSIFGFYKNSWGGMSGECFYLPKGYYTIVVILEIKNYNNQYLKCTPFWNKVTIYPNGNCPSNNNTTPKFAYPINNNEDVLTASNNLKFHDYIFTLDFCKDCRTSFTSPPTLSCAKQKYVTPKTTYYYFTFYLGENATFKTNNYYELYEGNAVQNPNILNDYKKIIDPCDNTTTICNLKGNTTYTLVVFSNNDLSAKSQVIFTRHMPSPNDFAAGATNLGHFSVNDTRQSSFSPITCHTNGLKSDPGRYSGINYYGTSYVIPYKDSLNKKRSTNYKNLWYTFTVTGNTKINISSIRKFNNNAYYENFTVFRYRGPYHENYQQTLKDNFDSSSNRMRFITSSHSGNPASSFYNDTCGESRYFVLLDNNYAELTEEYSIKVSTEVQVVPTSGDFCSNAMSGTYTKFGSYKLTTNNACHTYGSSPFETTNPGYKSTWFKISVTNVQKFDLQIKANSRYGLQSFNVYGGTCKAMTRITSAANAYSYFTLSCMGNGDYFIQAISSDYIDDMMEFQIDIIKPVNIVCKPYDFKFPIAQFKLSGGCNKQDTVTIQNLSTAGEDIQYSWFINKQLFSKTFQPFFTRKHPFLKDTNIIRLIILNTAELTKDTFELQYLRDTNHYLFKALGPATSHCSDTLRLSVSTNFPHKLNYKWYQNYNSNYPISYLPTYVQNSTSNTWYIVKAESDNCQFVDTFKTNFITSLHRYRDTAMCQWQRYVIKNKGDNYMYINNQYLAMGDSLVYNYSTNLHIIYYEKNCYYNDSVKIKVEPGAKNQVEFENVYACNINSFKFQYKKEPLLKYAWNTGDTTPAITATQNGVYRLKGPISKCRNLDYSWKLTMENVNTHLLRDTTVCKNDVLDFYNVFGSKYQVLYKSPNSNSIKINGPLKKILKVKRSECYIEDSSMVHMFPDNGKSIDSFMCNEKPVFAEYLDAGIAKQYNWFRHNGSGRFLLINNYGNYPVARKDNNGCTDTLNYNIITNCEFRVYVPNALTPNADNMNETFGPYISGQFTRYSMNIYTRWGELVYKTDKSETWNGYFGDKQVSDGVYCYFITVYDQYNKPFVFKGTITILY